MLVEIIQLQFVSVTPTLMNNINLFSITHSVDYCLIVDLEYEDEVEGMTRAKYAYRASEPYGFSPLY